eukprot:TRINITY_DN21223_c0_g1_i2.p1 TRINITY_DN21223_c0_g1~~TRINITY_DN21223_c0_g1_i2.p1  ORF type:complete len:627 (-),score=117.64 TRINITY_DN21223_c0_g1_i2:43-1923(-)
MLCHAAVTQQHASALKPSYPMHVLAVPEFMKLDRFVCHDELLEKGLLTKWSSGMHGKVIMISHQWLGYREPDPGREHHRCLKRLLARLMSGDIKRVESYYLQLLRWSNKRVRSSEWKRALPDMYLWIDYSCMPQLGADSSDEQRRKAASAVASIPSYVERCGLLLALVPVCKHHDTGEICNFASWRTRGWCRMEAFCSILASNETRVMICTGEESNPFFMYLGDVWMTKPIEGQFTCCSLDHCINGQSIRCDKEHVRSVLQILGVSKVQALRLSRSRIEELYFSALCDHLVEGEWQQTASQQGLHFTKQGAKAHQFVADVIRSRCNLGNRDAVRSFFNWTDPDDADVEGSGISLLLFAAAKGEAAAVSEIAALSPHIVNRRTLRRVPDMWIALRGMTPIMLAMSIANFDTVEALLEAGAETQLVGELGLDALMLACIHGNAGNVEAWLKRFPDWDVNRPSSVFKFNALCLTLAQCPDSSAIVHLLLAARASTATQRPGFLLPILAMKEDSDPKALKLLLEQRVDVNERLRGQIFPVRCFYRCLRLCVRLGLGGQPIEDWAMLDRSTALHIASKRGDVGMAQALLESKAQPLQNAQGRSPLDLATATFGGQLPEELMLVLGQTPLEN